MACQLANAPYGTTAASSNVSDPGFKQSFCSEATAYSAHAPRQVPNTASPTLNRVTLRPTSSTWPATFVPGTRDFGARNPNPRTRIKYGSPAMKCQAPRSTPAATTDTSTSPSPMVGFSTSPNSSTSAEP